jgi:hypothetical protein
MMFLKECVRAFDAGVRKSEHLNQRVKTYGT